MKCEFFIGILGRRYGYVPKKYDVPDTEEFDWLKTYPPNASVTELEMHLGALSNPGKRMGKAFFYVRDPGFEL
jgi:telomerase protein component 1